MSIHFGAMYVPSQAVQDKSLEEKRAAANQLAQELNLAGKSAQVIEYLNETVSFAHCVVTAPEKGILQRSRARHLLAFGPSDVSVGFTTANADFDALKQEIQKKPDRLLRYFPELAQYTGELGDVVKALTEKPRSKRSEEFITRLLGQYVKEADYNNLVESLPPTGIYG